MADYIKLTKEGFVPYEWDADDYVPQATTQNICVHLRTRIELDEGITLGDVFSAVEAHPLLCEFIGHYSWCQAIDAFHAQAKQERKPKKPVEGESEEENEEVISLDVVPYAEIHHDKKTGEDSYGGVWWHFGGVGEKGTKFSVSYSPVNELVHLPIIIEPIVKFQKNHEPYFEAKCSCNLLEFLDAIYWDISFMGGPEENEAFLENIHCMVEDLKTGLATTKPLEFDDED